MRVLLRHLGWIIKSKQESIHVFRMELKQTIIKLGVKDNNLFTPYLSIHRFLQQQMNTI